ncbi:porin, partial [Methylobacterium variabile]
SAFIGSYGEQSFGKASRSNLAALGSVLGVTPLGNPTLASFAFNSVLRDTNQIVAGASLIWSPIKDLDIGVEGLYARQALGSGRVVDANKTTAVPNGVNAAGLPTFNGAVLPTVSSTDSFQLRMRVQRDF